jgi:endonuclease/exonuclease/phosphatase family metal-dependent hydrolase
VVVVNTHMLANYDEDWTTGNRFVTEQRKDLAQLAEAVRRLDRESLVIVAGDFNVPMTNPLFVEFTSRCDLRSAFGPAPDAAPATIRQARPDRPALTIDNVLFRAPAGSSFQATARLRFEEPVMLTSGRQTVASDHLAVEAEFVF